MYRKRILEDRPQGHPLISQVVVVGDQKSLIGALVTLDSEMLSGQLRDHGLSEMSASEASESSQVLTAIDRAIKRVDDSISWAGLTRKSRTLPIDFTVANEYMTPSMKVKRVSVTRGFNEEIEKIYVVN